MIELHEETLTDHRFGRFMTHNLADYHVPVHADVHAIDVIGRRDQPARRQGCGRDRHRRHRRGDRECGVPRDGQAGAGFADYAGQADAGVR
jgi:hypothetical protein